MAYTLEDIKNDIVLLNPKEFYIKHILRSDNWYFETMLGVGKEDIIRITDDFKQIVSQSLGISFNNIAMVGSGKLGYSLSPRSARQDKLFMCFSNDSRVRPESDIDIAIVSNQLFQTYWDLFRCSYSEVNKHLYRYISREIYRGYINEKNLLEIDGCRKYWNPISSSSKKLLHSDLYIKHEISYRLYRSWEDFEEYNIQSLEEIKRGEI